MTENGKLRQTETGIDHSSRIYNRRQIKTENGKLRHTEADMDHS